MSTEGLHIVHAVRELHHHKKSEVEGGIITGIATSVVAPAAVSAIGGAVAGGAGVAAGAVGTTGILGSLGAGLATVAAAPALLVGGAIVGAFAAIGIGIIKKCARK